MKVFLNAGLFQLLWFACVLGGNTAALVATCGYFLLHRLLFLRQAWEWGLIVSFVLLGILIDGSLLNLGILQQEGSELDAFVFPPLWLLCLWAGVASLFPHSLSWLRGKYLWAAIMGFVGPVWSYLLGAQMSEINISGSVWQTGLLMACIWMLLIPAGVFACEKLALFDNKASIK